MSRGSTLAAALLLVAALGAALVVADDAAGGAASDGPVRPIGAAAAGRAVIHDLPDWLPFGGLALGRHLFLQRSQQTPYGIEHELVHRRQQAAHPLWFWTSYLLLPRWRLRWEAEAYAAQARARCPIDGEHGLAAYLSGPAYLWPASRARAAAEIRRFL